MDDKELAEKVAGMLGGWHVLGYPVPPENIYSWQTAGLCIEKASRVMGWDVYISDNRVAFGRKHPDMGGPNATSNIDANAKGYPKAIIYAFSEIPNE